MEYRRGKFEVSVCKDPDTALLCFCFSRLYVLQGGLAQQEWRVPELLHRLLKYLEPKLTQVYKNVRERIGRWVLFSLVWYASWALFIKFQYLMILWLCYYWVSCCPLKFCFVLWELDKGLWMSDRMAVCSKDRVTTPQFLLSQNCRHRHKRPSPGIVLVGL